MGLDWIVKTFKKNTYEPLTITDPYTGINYIRGKSIVYSLLQYGANEDFADKCWGEEITMDDDDINSFVDPSLLLNIHNFYDKVKLIETDEMDTIVEQQQEIDDVLTMYNDIVEFNENSKDYVARIWAWY
tara:strand:- start:638 stop:1027 length:390 start_codon:yes stop_codon:yes gene_type:complete